MLELTSSPGPGHGLNIMKGHCRIGLSFQSSIERMVSLWNAMFFFLNKLNSWSMLMLMLMLMSMSCSHILLKKMWCLRTSKKTWFNLSFSSSSSSFLWQIQGEILFFFFFCPKQDSNCLHGSASVRLLSHLPDTFGQKVVGKHTSFIYTLTI
jgi:hypothetical protein